MSTQTTPRPVTAEDVLRRSDFGSCELVEGKIKKMSPTNWKHGDVEYELAWYLGAFVREHELGRVMGGEVGIVTRRDPDTARGADVLFISHERLEKASPEGFLDVAPELVVEVTSPSNTWEEMRRKIGEYFSIGVERVWIVEPENRAVLVYRSPGEAETLEEEDTLEGEGQLEGFSLPVTKLFEA